MRQLVGSLALVFSLVGCTSGSLYSFVVYASPEPKTMAALFRLPFAEPDEVWAGRGTGSPSLLRVSIYSFYLSEAANCATPVALIDYGSDPLTKEFYGRPTLFSGNPGPGAYNCVVIKVSDTLSFRPDTTASAGVAACGTSSGEYRFDGYRADQTEAGTWKALSGQAVQASGALAGPSQDVVTLFATTDPASAIAYRGLAASQMIPLAAPVQVPGDITLYSSYLDAVTQDSGVCTLSGGLALGLN